MQSFIYNGLPSRVVFGTGSLDRLADETSALNITNALVLSTPRQRHLAENVVGRLANSTAGIFDQAVMHVPTETATTAVTEAKRLQADACIAIGGGSTIGLAKAIALDLGLPIIAVPTTYAGSEMTPIWGLTEGGVKRTGRDQRVLPKTVIYDPALSASLPAKIAGPSGINAIAHCVEALYAPDANPIISMMAEEGIRALAHSLPKIVATPDDLVPRSDALYGAWLAGAALGVVAMSLHHKLCHTLGGTFNLPHAETHTIVLPHAAAYNRTAAPKAMARVARALDCDDGPTGLFDLARDVGAKTALQDIGLRHDDLTRAAELATKNPYANPAPVTLDGVRALLDDAYEGRRPAA